MNKSAAMDEFMRRLRENGIKGRISKIGEAATTQFNAYFMEKRTSQHLDNISTSTNIASMLLSLPAELREQIWHDVLVSPTGFVRPLRSGLRQKTLAKHDFHIVDSIDPKARPEYGLERLYIPGEQIHLSLLFTNRQINRECEHIFWGMNVFILKPDDSCMISALFFGNVLSISFCRKIKNVQLDINIGYAQLALEPHCNRKLKTALATIGNMAEEGALKGLSMKPFASLDNIEEIIDIVTGELQLQVRMPRYQDSLTKVMSMFVEINEGGQLNNVRKTVEVDIGWDEMHARSQEKWASENGGPAWDLLHSMAKCMGGIDGELWVDDRLCFENVDGTPQSCENLFPLKALGESKRRGSKCRHTCVAWE